jgi:hypothetical protein
MFFLKRLSNSLKIQKKDQKAARTMDIGSVSSYLNIKEFQILFNGILQVVKNQIDENSFLSSSNINENDDYEILIEKLKSLNNDLESSDLQNIISVFELVRIWFLCLSSSSS